MDSKLGKAGYEPAALRLSYGPALAAYSWGFGVSIRLFDFWQIWLTLSLDKIQLGRPSMEGKAQVEITYCVT